MDREGTTLHGLQIHGRIRENGGQLLPSFKPDELTGMNVEPTIDYRAQDI